MFSLKEEARYSLMRYAVSKFTGGIYMSINEMPSDNISMEKYVVYSPDGIPDDNRSLKSGRSDSITFTDPAYVDLAVEKQTSGTTLTLTASSPAPTSSTLTSDKWQSYWSKRERCCCFWNFLLTIASVVLVIIVVMATKGLITLAPTNVGNESGLYDEFDRNDATSTTTNTVCTTTTAAPPEVSNY